MVSVSSGWAKPGHGGAFYDFQQSEPLQSRAEAYKSPGDNSSPAGRTIAAGIGTASFDGQIVWWDGFKVSKDGKVTASFVMNLADCIFTPTFDLVRLFADEQIIVSNETPVRTSSQKIRYYDGSQTTPDPLLVSKLGADGASAWPRMAYAVFEDFDCEPYGRRVPLIRAVLSGEASSSGSASDEVSTLTFGDLSDDDWVTVSTAYDRIRRVIYLSHRESGMVNTGYLSTIDIATNREIARVPISIADGSVWETPNSMLALDGSDYLVFDSLIDNTDHELCLLNVVTGEIVAHLPPPGGSTGGTNTCQPMLAALIENGAATKYLLFAIPVFGSSPTNGFMIVVLVDTTNETLEFLIHPAIPDKKVGTASSIPRSITIGPLDSGVQTAYFAEARGLHYYSDPQPTVRKLQISATGFTESVFYTEAESGKMPLSVAYDFNDDGVVITREDGSIKKVLQDGSVGYTAPGAANTILLCGWGRLWSSTALIGALVPGYDLAFADDDSHSKNPNDFDVHLVNLRDGSTRLLLEGANRVSGPLYYYDQLRGLLIEEHDDPDATIPGGGPGRILQHGSGGDVTPNHVDLVDAFKQLAGFDGRFDPENDLVFTGFPGNEMYGLKLENDTTIDNLEQSLAEPFDVKIVESDGKRKYFYPPRDGSFVIDATLDVDDFVERGTTIIEKGMGSGEEELAACTIAYFDRDAGYKKLEQTYQRPVGVFDTTRSKKKRTVNTPMTLTASQAKRLVTEIVFRSVIGNESAGFGLVPKQMHREPGDILAIPFLGQTLVVRITEATLKADYTQDCFADQYLRFTDAEITADEPDQGASDLVSLDTRLLYLDLPLLSAAHDLAGTGLVQYVLPYGSGEALVSGGVYRSLDGFEYSLVGARSRIAPVIGIVTDISGTPADPFVKDETNTIEVQIQSGDIDRLGTITDAQFEAGSNLAAIGRNGRWVLVWFQTVTPNSPPDSKVTLSDLMWGVRGSEVWIDSLQAGDLFVRLDAAEYLRFRNAIAWLDDPVLYKAANPSVSLGSVQTHSYLAAGVAETPYAPVNLGAEFAGSDIRFFWDYRSRVASGLNPSNHGEAELAFELDILDSGDVVVRTIQVTTNEAIWTAADITSDFGSLPPSWTWRVAMMSDLVGRGYEAEATSTVNEGAILLAGDEQTGTDQLALAGDEQSGTDAEALREIITT